MVHTRIDGFLLDLVPRKAGLDAARGDWGDWWGQRVGLHLKCTRESILYVMCYGPASRGTSVSQTGIDKATDWVSLEERGKYARPSVYKTNTWTLFLENSGFVVILVCILSTLSLWLGSSKFYPGSYCWKHHWQKNEPHKRKHRR